MQFDSGEDVINLSGIDANTATQENDLIGFTGYRTAANSVWLRDTGNHMLVQADVDSDRRYDFYVQLVRLDSMSEDDFIF